MILSNLKGVRLEQALSLRALSTLSRVSVTTIARAERGEDVYGVTVRKLARALGVKPAELMAPPAAPTAARVPATTPTAIRSGEQHARMLEELREDARRARERGDEAAAGRYEAAIRAARGA